MKRERKGQKRESAKEMAAEGKIKGEREGKIREWPGKGMGQKVKISVGGRTKGKGWGRRKRWGKGRGKWK
jgi:hypothetical protein